LCRRDDIDAARCVRPAPPENDGGVYFVDLDGVYDLVVSAHPVVQLELRVAF
jgi:hypothetical protein